MLNWILKNIESVGFDKKDLRKIEIASEEILVNIITHAYQGEPDNIIQISIIVNVDNIRLKFSDNGPKFNPIQNISIVDENATLEERPLGGLGLFLTHKYMDDIIYERDSSMNILTLIKKVNY
jgi:serine/threonine-protein kinase RsbW